MRTNLKSSHPVLLEGDFQQARDVRPKIRPQGGGSAEANPARLVAGLDVGGARTSAEVADAGKDRLRFPSRPGEA